MVFFKLARFAKDGFYQEVTQWGFFGMLACVPVSFCLVVTLILAASFVFTNWGGPAQRDRFSRRFSDLILRPSRIVRFVARQQVVPWFGNHDCDAGESRRSQFFTRN